MIRLTLPLPPSVNGAYATVGKRRVKSKDYKIWLAQADSYLLMQWKLFKPITGRYMLRIILPQNMRGDASNRIKICEDFLVSREVTPDDKHCQKASAERDASVPAHVCRVEIETA